MDALESLTLDVLQAMMGEAIVARHNLVTQPASVSSGGRSMNHFGKNIAEVDAYIARLQRAIDAKSGRMTAGPIYLTGGR
jgi:hypothetical protein